MTQSQFYMRIVLLIAVGIVYVKAYMNMAVRNSKEIEPERHLTLRILGVFWTIMAIYLGGMGIYYITQISFPYEAIGPFISPNMIIRTPGQALYWGYPTFPQSQCFNIISGFFTFLALSAYCFLFKSSHSKWHTKVGKIIFCIFFCMFFFSATDFHYFDLYEWISPILFAIMAFFAFKTSKNEPAISSVDGNKISISTPLSVSGAKNTTRKSHTEDDSKYMPHIEENDNKNKTEKSQSPVPVEKAEPMVRFCRHCGAEIDYQLVRFCKHCGKQLN